jgi:predicted acetyltransferase
MKPETVEIGIAETRELDTVLEILCEAFQMVPEAARPVFYNDPYFHLENKRVLRVNGRVVSCLTIVEAECWIGASAVKLGGIAGVATRSEARNQGYAGRLLADTVRALRERGFGLSALIPARQEFYRRYGWEIAGHAHRYLTAPAHLPAFPERQNVRPTRPEDIPDLARLYEAWATSRTLHCRRDAKRWQYILDNVRQRVVYVSSEGDTQGYLLYDFLVTDAGGMETEPSGVALPPTLRVLEMQTATPEARRGLLGFLASQTQVGCIEATATLDDITRNGLLGLRNGQTDLDALASLEIVPALMARVIDPLRLAKQMEGNWQNFDGALQIEMRDPLADGGVTSLRIEGHGGTARVLPAGEKDVSTVERIQGDVRAWTQVVTGHIGADDACALGFLQPLTPSARTFASFLFPQRTPFLPLTDHF